MSTHVAFARRGGSAVIAIAVAVTTALLLLIGPGHAAIVPTVPLGTADQYSVLAYSTVTNTGPSVLNLGLGLHPGSSVTGSPTVLGATNVANAAALQAKNDLDAAYTNAAGRPPNATLAVDLVGANLQGGVYESTSSGALALSGAMTLDGAGDPSSVFIFQSSSTLITSAGSTVNLINGAQECNVFWQVGSSATLGTNSVFRGNILALADVHVQTGATVHGRALARTGEVTLDNNTFTSPSCDLSSPTPTTAPGGGGGTGTTPTDATPSSGSGSGSGSGTGRGSGSPSSPGVPSVVAPPRTGGGPLSGDTLPWPALLFFGVIGVGGTVAVVRSRNARLRDATAVDH